MGCKHFLLVCVTLLCFYFAVVVTQGRSRKLKIPPTRFSCRDRPSGYYADVDTGCQVYHMCDGLGRQFSYSCPNTTLFQQRMLICDHWYMVNCSKSESDYSANLLIGQRDKPFVTDAEMQQLRTPRPDILSVPANENYYDGLREAESKYAINSDNSIVGIGNSIDDDYDLDNGKGYRPPTSWSTGTGVRGTIRPGKKLSQFDRKINDLDSIAGAASHDLGSTLKPAINRKISQETQLPPSRVFLPPIAPSTTETTTSSEELNADVETKVPSDAVINFVNRFDPNLPKSIKTAMTQTEILDLNKELPDGQSSAEDERTTSRSKNFGSNFNFLNDDKKKGVISSSRFDSVNIKPDSTELPISSNTDTKELPVPEKVLLPPKLEYTDQPGTTVGPPIYYEWKWAVPALDLEPPLQRNDTNEEVEAPQARSVSGSVENPFSHVTRPPPVEVDIIPRNVEYNISSYLVPDYVFPLDNPHPGYEEQDAKTSFLAPKKDEHSFGENPACPECHPAFVVPGTCEPCIVNR